MKCRPRRKMTSKEGRLVARSIPIPPLNELPNLSVCIFNFGTGETILNRPLVANITKQVEMSKNASPRTGEHIVVLEDGNLAGIRPTALGPGRITLPNQGSARVRLLNFQLAALKLAFGQARSRAGNHVWRRTDGNQGWRWIDINSRRYSLGCTDEVVTGADI